ncbi:hypothetical protein GCM10011391_26250 [Pullulanibacillus camelliae]|uniref:DUF503 domain-containing protein n=1 Tax=Pullulanibacillus camelliae TaxID=1707096 RepID=A0A8J2YIZ7_9BACL|nr:DUF503 domain-containing protein [Pullulanibacillus camelliae]GGE46207.1 hypothetical protein GCM10011391_26250 [Pullulanibacillus camelliae]
MIIGSVTCECMLYNAQSLKDKRSVIKSIITRVKNRLNVACAEIGHQDVWQRTELIFVSVATSKIPVEKELERALRILDGNAEIERASTRYEWL